MEKLPDDLLARFINDVTSLVIKRFHALRENTTPNSKFIIKPDNTQYKNVVTAYNFINSKKKYQTICLVGGFVNKLDKLKTLNTINLEFRLSASNEHTIELFNLKRLYISLVDPPEPEIDDYSSDDIQDDLLEESDFINSWPLQKINIVAEYFKLSIIATGISNIIFDKETEISVFELELCLYRNDNNMAPDNWKLDIVHGNINIIFSAMEIICSKLKLFVINLSNLSIPYSPELKNIIDNILSSKIWRGDINIIGNDYEITRIADKVTYYNFGEYIFKNDLSFGDLLKNSPDRIIFDDDKIVVTKSKNKYQFDIEDNVIELLLEEDCEVIFKKIKQENIKIKTNGYLKNVFFTSFNSTITFENETVIENLTLDFESFGIIGNYTCIKLYCPYGEIVTNINHIVKYSHNNIY